MHGGDSRHLCAITVALELASKAALAFLASSSQAGLRQLRVMCLKMLQSHREGRAM